MAKTHLKRYGAVYSLSLTVKQQKNQVHKIMRIAYEFKTEIQAYRKTFVQKVRENLLRSE